MDYKIEINNRFVGLSLDIYRKVNDCKVCKFV